MAAKSHKCTHVVILVVGTYYGQWVSGLRHGYGVRQSAPFSIATPVRHEDSGLRQLSADGRRPRYHNSMPVLNSASSPSPADDRTTRPADTGLTDRGRSGFVLTGDRNTASVGRLSRSRSTSMRRRIADSFSSLNRRKRKTNTMINDTSQVCKYVTLS